jgi:hypothetical protein
MGTRTQPTSGRRTRQLGLPFLAKSGHQSVTRPRSLGSGYACPVRLSEFWKRMDVQFGESYAHSVAADYRVTALGGTVNEALTRGDSPKSVWRAVCTEFNPSGPLH